jgi:hypothetical protein
MKPARVEIVMPESQMFELGSHLWNAGERRLALQMMPDSGAPSCPVHWGATELRIVLSAIAAARFRNDTVSKQLCQTVQTAFRNVLQGTNLLDTHPLIK